jgi:glycosyltransferase involved in cell wall biosynthesis
VTTDPSDQHARPAPVAGGLSLVVPVFNERESLADLFAEIVAVSKQSVEWRFEVVFVDDGSTDGSWQEVRNLAEADGRVRGVRFRRNFGKAAALAAGFREATGEIVVTLDADLQDDPTEIPRFVEAIRGGFDVVSGFKEVRRDPWHKVFPSRVFNRMVSGLTGVKLRDHNCGFKAYRAEVVRRVRLYGELHRFVPVLAAEKGYRVGELVIHHRPRKFGRSKYGWRRFTRGFLDLISVQFLTGYGDRPQHFLGRLGLVPLALGFLGLVVLVANWLLRLFWPDAGIGQFPQLVGAVFAVGLLLFGSQLVIAGLLAELVVDRDPSLEPPYSIQDRTLPAADS